MTKIKIGIKNGVTREWLFFVDTKKINEIIKTRIPLLELKLEFKLSTKAPIKICMELIDNDSLSRTESCSIIIEEIKRK